jgi:hypothetical protein
MKLSQDFKAQVYEALLERRPNFSGSDANYAKSYGIPPSIYSLIKHGKVQDGQLKEAKIVAIGRTLGVSTGSRDWRIARTTVFEAIEEDATICKAHGKAMILVDEPEIGKTETAKYLAKTWENTFYIDCSQCKSKSLFIRELAKVLGIDQVGTYAKIKADIKYYLQVLPQPLIFLDEGGDLSYAAFLDIKEFWNATEGQCGWYMMGADGLKKCFENGIRNQKVGYREIFSRFGSKCMSIVPRERTQRQLFYRDLLQDVLNLNVTDKPLIPTLVKQCLATDAEGHIGGLRRASTLLDIHQHNA